jgi:hypothetical protein
MGPNSGRADERNELVDVVADGTCIASFEGNARRRHSLSVVIGLVGQDASYHGDGADRD